MDPIVREELTLLAQTRRALEEQPDAPPARERDIVAELVRLRDEVQAAKEEDKGALMAQFNANNALLGQLRNGRDRGEVDPDSPYFAHLQLEEAGRRREVLLGKATRLGPGLRIVDWRNAPVSQLFYKYRQGEWYEEEMGGRTQEGRITVRRTVRIRRGQLQRVDAPEGVWLHDGDRGWERLSVDSARLAGGAGETARAYQPGEGSGRRMGTDAGSPRRRADKHLPDIAGLIDPEQFEVITRPTSGLVVVRGTAGSGKTTVALHRIAWMAFQDPAVDSPDTLFVVFSPALRDYVSHVLPSLGVHQVQVRAFRDLAHELVRRHFSMLPRQVREDTPAGVVRLKLHPAVMMALEHQVQRLQRPATAEQAIDDWLSVTTQPDLLRGPLEQLDPEFAQTLDLNKVTTWCRDRAEELEAWREGARDLLPALDAEDLALLLRAYQLRVGPLRAKTKRALQLRHLAIDEVQDFAPIEVRVLLDCLDTHRSVTLAGDTQQHVMKDAGFTSWSAFFQTLGLEGKQVDTLRVSYRSSRQVVAFALNLLGDLREDDEPPQVTKDGPPVELFRATDHGEVVAFLADVLRDLMSQEPTASVVLLTPNAAVSGLYHDGLQRAEVPYLRRVTRHDFSFAPGVEVAEVDQVKGLEFDYVIVLEATPEHYPDRPQHRRLLHVAATRAVHQLWLTAVGDASPIVEEALAQCRPSAPTDQATEN